MLHEKIFNSDSLNDLVSGISPNMTLDILDYYAEHMTRLILQKIFFYEHFHPQTFIKNGLFSNDTPRSCNNNINEFLIPIKISVFSEKAQKLFTDNFYWDLLNKNLTPEKFAEVIVQEEGFENNLIVIISLQIRKEIHNYVYERFENLAKNFEKYEQGKFFNEEKISKKITRKSDDTHKNVITFLFDDNLTKMLGKKRGVNENNESNVNESEYFLPNFLRNNQRKKNKIEVDDKNINISSKGNKSATKDISINVNVNNKNNNNKKSGVKNSGKKTVNIIKGNNNSNNKNNCNAIEHDKQSTTIDENEDREERD